MNSKIFQFLDYASTGQNINLTKHKYFGHMYCDHIACGLCAINIKCKTIERFLNDNDLVYLKNNYPEYFL